MLLFEERIVALEFLQADELCGRRGACSRAGAPCQAVLAHVRAPLGQHSGMDRQRRSDGAHLNPRLMTQLHSRQLELVTVLPNAPWAWSRHGRHSA